MAPITPVSTDPILPDARKEPLPPHAQYKVPREFWDAKANAPINLDQWSPLTGMFDSFPAFFDSVLSGFGLVPKPRNVVNMCTNPIDYLTGDVETEMLKKRAGIPKHYMPNYTPVDENWQEAQLAAAGASMGLAFLLEAWSGGKNTDGNGRTTFFLGQRDPYTGRRAMGAVPLNIIMSAIYLTGGSLASQHRMLMGDGMSATEAYLTAAFPFTGWPLTFLDSQHAFYDFIHADFTASSLQMVYYQYVARAGGILGVMGYALTGSEHLAPALEQYLALKRAVPPARVEGQKGPTQIERQLALFPDKLAYVVYRGSHPDELNAGLRRIDEERAVVSERFESLKADKAKLLAQKALRPKDISVTAEIGKVGAELDALDRYLTDLKEIEAKLKTGEAVSLTRKVDHQDVKRLAITPFRSRTFPVSGTAAGDAVDLLEAARNRRALPNGKQRAFLEKFPGAMGAPMRFAYGLTAGAFGDGKWRIRAASYGGSVAVSYLFNVLTYHYQWDMPWEQSFRSGASVFVTIAAREPWIGALKAAGVEKIPVVLGFLPSAAMVNGLWSVTQWDREIMLQRCLFERSNLIHSLDPEFRKEVRGRMAHAYQLATPEEKRKWSLPLEDGGCGTPIPLQDDAVM